MRLLAFDCAGDRRTAALLDDDGVVASAFASGASRHAEALIPLVETLLADAGWRYLDLDLLAVGHGPGSFTGIRVAVAAGRGLALALDRPVLGIDGRDVLLHRTGAAETTVVAAIDARRGGLYAAWNGLAQGRSEVALNPAELALRLDGRLVARGSGASLLAAVAPSRIEVEPEELDPAAFGRFAQAMLARGITPIAGYDLHPCYVRAADVVLRAS